MVTLCALIDRHYGYTTSLYVSSDSRMVMVLSGSTERMYSELVWQWFEGLLVGHLQNMVIEVRYKHEWGVGIRDCYLVKP